MKQRALVGFAYPDPQDLPRVLKAGGLRNVPEKERAEIWSRRVEVEAGAFHDGPEELRAGWLEAGLVEEVEDLARETAVEKLRKAR